GVSSETPARRVDPRGPGRTIRARRHRPWKRVAPDLCATGGRTRAAQEDAAADTHRIGVGSQRLVENNKVVGQGDGVGRIDKEATPLAVATEAAVAAGAALGDVERDPAAGHAVAQAVALAPDR